jgi:hypothetical protein
MIKNLFRRNHLSLWVIPGALIFMGILFGLCGISLWLISSPLAQTNNQVAVITVIPASTSTPSEFENNNFLTPTNNGGEGPTNGISLENYVQIFNTGGDGLKLRSGPGINSPARFLGKEAEVFQVKDGPRKADGFTWWFLVTPYDEHRSGWAASTYLSVIASPN